MYDSDMAVYFSGKEGSPGQDILKKNIALMKQ